MLFATSQWSSIFINENMDPSECVLLIGDASRIIPVSKLLVTPITSPLGHLEGVPQPYASVTYYHYGY